MNPRLALAVILACLLAACGKPPAESPTGPPPILLPETYQWLSPKEAAALMQKQPNLGVLDTREDSERLAGNGFIHGATPLPYFQDQEKNLAAMDRNRPWLVYCAIGGRSELVAQIMAKLNFKEVYLVKGGFNAWRADGLPVDK